MQLKSNRHCNAIAGCVKYVKGMLIFALFVMRELNASNFGTSELRALNIEYLRYVYTEKRVIAPLRYWPILDILWNHLVCD